MWTKAFFKENAFVSCMKPRFGAVSGARKRPEGNAAQRTEINDEKNF